MTRKKAKGICLVTGCRKAVQVFNNGKGRPSYRCPDHNHELAIVRREFDSLAGDLMLLGDKSGRVRR